MTVDPQTRRPAAWDVITVGSTLGGIVAWLGAVLPAAISYQRDMVPPAWWVLALVQLASFLYLSATRTRPSRVHGPVAALMVITGIVVVAMWGADQVSAVLMVLASGAVGFVLPTPVSFGIAALQSIALVIILVVQDETVVWALIYSALMFFAALMVDVVVREGKARERAAAAVAQLEVTNAELGRANERLQAANVELHEAQQALAEASRAEERLRISRDLHDGMGQQLTALRLHLDLISRHIDDEGAEHVDQAKVLVAGVIRDVRGVVTHLRNGHVKARDEIARLARSLPRPETSLDLDPAIDEAPQPVAISLVRVVQEGLTNVARHSQAKHAWVRITREVGAVAFEIRDDGPGLASITPGNGLSGMAERVSLVGGELTWHTAPGEGFRLSGRLPDEVAGAPQS